MHLLFEIFVLPPLVIASVVLIATWNLCDAVIAFRVGSFMSPICGLFVGQRELRCCLLRSYSQSFGRGSCACRLAWITCRRVCRRSLLDLIRCMPKFLSRL